MHVKRDVCSRKHLPVRLGERLRVQHDRVPCRDLGALASTYDGWNWYFDTPRSRSGLRRCGLRRRYLNGRYNLAWVDGDGAFGDRSFGGGGDFLGDRHWC